MNAWNHPAAGLHAALRAAPDDAVTTGWDEDFTDDPDVTYASSPDGLRELAAALNASCQWQIDPDYIESQVRHEQEHAAAALAAGFSKIRYGLFVHRAPRNVPGGVTVRTDWRMMINHVAPAGPVSKLAYAAIVAAPAVLSAGDEEALRVMGYRNAADVTKRIARR
jgi:hypothetical protein